MPDDPTPSPAAPAADPSPAPVPSTEGAPSTPTDADVSAAIDSLGELSAAQLQAIENGDFSSLAGDAPKPEGDKKPETEKKPDLTPENTEDDRLPGRIGLGGIKEESKAKMVQLAKLMKAGVEETEAIAQVFGVTKSAEVTPPVEAGDKAPEPEAPQAPEVPEAIKFIEDAITAKKAEIARVKGEYGDTTDLLEQLSDLKLDLREAKREHERATVEQQAFQKEVVKSRDKMLAQYADLWSDVRPGKKKSDFETLCDREFSLAEAENDPVFSQPDWPEQIAKRVKEKFFDGLSVHHNADREGDEPTIPPLPKQSVRLPGSLTGTTDAPGVLTPGNIMAQFDTLTDEQQLEVLKRAGG